MRFFNNDEVPDTEREIGNYQQGQQRNIDLNDYSNQQYTQNNYQQPHSQQRYSQQGNNQYTQGYQQGYSQKGNNQQFNQTGQSSYTRTYTNTYVNGVHTNRTVTTEYSGDNPNFGGNSQFYGGNSSAFGNRPPFQNNNTIYEDCSNTSEQVSTASPHAKLLKDIAFVWSLVSIGIMVVGAVAFSEYFIAVAIGQALAIVPTLLLFSKKKLIFRLLSIPFIGVGIFLMVAGISSMTGGDLLETFLNQDATSLQVVLFIGTTIGSIVLAIKFTKDLITTIKSCTVPVSATIVRYYRDTRWTKKRTIIKYYPVYSYEYNGRIYEIKGECPNFGLRRREGSVVEIKVNPNNPTKFRDKNTFPHKAGMILACIAFCVASISMFIKITSIYFTMHH